MTDSVEDFVVNGHLALLAAMWGGCGSYMRPRREPLAGVDIEREYALIQRKASNLSASQRREVERRYHRIHNKQLNTNISVNIDKEAGK